MTKQIWQEFVAKLLWYSWDAGTRSAFAQPGGVGLKVLQVPGGAGGQRVFFNGFFGENDNGDSSSWAPSSRDEI